MDNTDVYFSPPSGIANFYFERSRIRRVVFCDPAFCISLGFGEPHLVQLVEVAFYARIIKNMQKLLNGKNFFSLIFTKLRLIIIAVFISVSVVTISAQETTRYQPKQPQYDNLKYGVPGRADTIVEREGYALGYIEKHEQPSWVCYIVTKEELSIRAAKRTNNFRADPSISTGSAHPSDYTRSGFDRGHLAPAADMSFSQQAMSDSFFMSNMSPQRPQFNRGIWGKLEKQIRRFANREGMIVVVTGPILPETPTLTSLFFCFPDFSSLQLFFHFFSASCFTLTLFVILMCYYMLEIRKNKLSG